jgi:DNA topoisomerase-1
MAANLVIVESPAKCGKIRGFLGPDYNVVATMGHIRALEEDLAAIGIERDFALKYTFLKEKARAIAGLKSAAEAATTVYLAADDDREGEAIAYSVCVLLGLDPVTTPRAVFHEITKKAVTAAVANPRRLDMNRVNAQQARAALDMMIGFTISPLLWTHVSRGLSAGRCQTPALRLVVDREKEIEGHSAESGWKMTGEWTARGGLVPFRFDATLMEDIEDEDSVRNYMENLVASPTHVVTAAALSEWKQNAPLPFTTSTLQQAASSTLKSTPKKTMAAAQKLYEAGHITYMRTDSTNLSADAVNAAHQIIRAKWGDEFCGVVKSAAAAAAAHEAIRPTHFEVEVDDIPGDWTLTEKRLYKMIHLRAMQSTMAAMRGEQKTVEFLADELRWRASWRRTTFAGWRKAGESASEGAEDSGAEGEEGSAGAWDAAIRIGQGDSVTWESLQAVPFQTTAAKRYTEATLIKQLEKSGIGRPSTFASLVETIMDKKYVEKKDIPGREIDVRTLSLTRSGGCDLTVTSKKVLVGGERDKLVATELGKQVLLFCLNHFDVLFNYTFTAKMEGRLDLIANGAEEWKGVLRDTWGTYRDIYKGLLGGGAASEKATKKVFSGGLVAIIRKSGEPLLLKEIPGAPKTAKPTFYGWPSGVSFADMTEEKARAFISQGKSQGQGQVQETGDVLGHWNGQAVIKKKGKFGDYIVCGDITASCGSNPTLEGAIEKLEEKAGMKTRVIGGYELRQPANGGGYMFKKALKAKKFVTIPAGLDIMKLSATEVEAIYKTGAGVENTAGKKYQFARKKTAEVK